MASPMVGMNWATRNDTIQLNEVARDEDRAWGEIRGFLLQSIIVKAIVCSSFSVNYSGDNGK